MDIIVKDRKSIRWVGLPAQLTQFPVADPGQAKAELKQRISQKTEELESLQKQFSLYDGLVKMNKSSRSNPDPRFLRPPFILIHTPNHAKITMRMTDDKSQYFLEFSLPIQFKDDIHLLHSILEK